MEWNMLSIDRGGQKNFVAIGFILWHSKERKLPTIKQYQRRSLMKRIKTIAVVLITALFCFAATAMANKPGGLFSFYDPVNEWIVTAYTIDNGDTPTTYSVYLHIRAKDDSDGTIPVDPADILLTVGENRKDPASNGDYLICNCAISGEISLAYTSSGGLSDIFVMDLHLNAQQQEFVKVHNTIQLSGFDLPDPANISVSGSGSFGTVNVGASSTNYFTVSNTGEEALNLTLISVTGTSFTRDGGSCSISTPVAGGSNCTIGVKFQPAAAAGYAGNLQINSNDSDTSTVNTPLSGTGFQQTGTPDLVVTKVLHGTNITDGGTLGMTVYVKNNGNGTSGPFVVRGTKGTTTEMYSWNIPSLAPGQEIYERHTYVITCATHQTFYLYHTADANSQVAESNEYNNRYISSVSCSR